MILMDLRFKALQKTDDSKLLVVKLVFYTADGQKRD